MDLLWPDATVNDAAPRLHKAAHYARRALGSPQSLVLAHESVSLFPDQDVRIDVSEFEALAEKALAMRNPDKAGRAIDAYGGELLPTNLYEHWVQETRDRLRLLYVEVLRLGGRLDRLTLVDPTDERAHLQLITALGFHGPVRLRGIASRLRRPRAGRSCR
jgi:DNA-binding SARP family transcriptional activator